MRLNCAIHMVAFVSIFLFLQLTTSCGFYSRPHPGRVINSLEAESSAFKIRVIQREQEGGALRAGYYFFESAPVKSDDWQNFLSVRDETMPPISRDHIGFVTADIAYVFMKGSYAATTDAGKTWSVWEAKNGIADWNSREYGIIKTVALNANGRGNMTLGPDYEPSTNTAELRTTDYGRHWMIH